MYYVEVCKGNVGSNIDVHWWKFHRLVKARKFAIMAKENARFVGIFKMGLFEVDLKPIESWEGDVHVTF